MQKILGYIRRAAEDYHMISAGDKIAVGVSGGKDSLVLLLALNKLKSFYPVPFEVMGITIDMGFAGMDFSAVSALCEENGIEYKTVKTDISDIVFNLRKEKNPCSLCAKMRRGCIHDAAIANGSRKLAFGHHMDDVVDTFFLNLFYESRLGCFQPVTYLDRKNVTVIRPLIYTPEKEIIRVVRKENLPVVESTCPANRNTKREYVKDVIKSLEKENRHLRENVFGALVRSGIDGWEPDRVKKQ